MAYITYEEYTQMYDAIDIREFNRLSCDACRIMDVHTTGVDNVKKLKAYFPADEDDAGLVKRCAANLVNFLHKVQQAEAAAMEAHGFISTENGMRGKVISSVSAGNESISYSTGSGSATDIDAAVKSKSTRDRMAAEIVWEYLAGVTDSNGVNLLYMGRYPRV